jgi:glucosamine-phosphate N-acetyltransferase
MTTSSSQSSYDIKIRLIQEKDLSNGFLESLDSLRMASNMDKTKAKKVLKTIQSNPYHIIFVAELPNGQIVGSTTLLIEPKFIHNGGLVGHIEDVVVSKKFQGLNIGKKLMDFSLKYAQEHGCYKTILCCMDDIIKFQKKNGFKIHGVEMRFDHNVQ